MNEPVTLFDLGMHRLRLDIEDATRVLPEAQASTETPLHGAYYNWRNRKIVAYVTTRQSFVDPTERACRQTFAAVSEHLMRATPRGPRRGEAYLENLFLHSGPGNLGRPKAIGRQLLDMVRLEISLLPPPPATLGGRSVRCGGRLDADPASIVVSASD